MQVLREAVHDMYDDVTAIFQVEETLQRLVEVLTSNWQAISHLHILII